MDDLISRQAAIEALGEKPIVWDDLSDFELGKATQWADDVEIIKNLPSAEQKVLKYTGESICLYCWTVNCDGCMYEPMEGCNNG